MSDHRNSDYLRRRREAEEKIAREGLMPDDPFIVGSVRVALFEKLVAENLMPSEPVVRDEPKPPAAPTAAQIASAMNKPVVRDDLTRRRAMQDAIGAEMAAARGDNGTAA
ncbi:MAG: hypothetical protein ACR2NB_06405 [Solirubrobacteraceae bacterium]